MGVDIELILPAGEQARKNPAKRAVRGLRILVAKGEIEPPPCGSSINFP